MMQSSKREFLMYKIAWKNYLNYTAKIRWSRLYTCEKLFNYCPENDDAYFYSIIGRRGQELKLFYIGMVYKQCVSERFKSEDHLSKVRALENHFSKYKIGIRLGVVKLTAPITKITKRRINAIEKLLIYINWNQDMINKKAVETINLSEKILIINSGDFKPLVRECGYAAIYKAS